MLTNSLRQTRVQKRATPNPKPRQDRTEKTKPLFPWPCGTLQLSAVRAPILVVVRARGVVLAVVAELCHFVSLTPILPFCGRNLRQNDSSDRTPSSRPCSTCTSTCPCGRSPDAEAEAEAKGEGAVTSRRRACPAVELSRWEWAWACSFLTAMLLLAASASVALGTVAARVVAVRGRRVKNFISDDEFTVG
ncbi:hypothetical protein VTI74DRAFT_5886 [Chaetomium olivicolor]